MFVAAYAGGLYAVPNWTTAAIVVWWAVAGALVSGVVPRRRIPRSTWIVGGLLTAFAAFTGLSSIWASGAEAPFLAMNRALLYVGIFALVVLFGTGRSETRWGDGIAVGLTAVVALSLTSRLFPGSLPGNGAFRFLPYAHTRLSYPVSYWNGLAVLAALACPLLLRGAVAANDARVRAAALVPLPALAAAIYLASSRSGAMAALVGIVAFVVLSANRWAAAGAAATGLATSVVAVALLARQHALVDGPLDSASARSQGWQTAIVLLALGLGGGSLYALLARRLRVPTLTRVSRGVIAGVVAIGTLVLLAAAHPERRWENFTQPPDLITDPNYVQTHFLSTNGNWRWQYWQSAVSEFRAHPLAGNGAGSYEAWWAQHGKLVGFIGNAHSLYFETLGDLGAVGLGLVVATFLFGAAVAVSRARRVGPAEVEAVAAVTAGFLAYAVAAGVDWMWELPAVSIVGVALLGLAVGPASSAVDAPPEPASRFRTPRLALIGLCALVLASQIDLFAADEALRSSQHAVARGDLKTAKSRARTARYLEPWAASPYLQLALIAEANGQFASASSWSARAIRYDPANWRLWLIDARLRTKRGDIAGAVTSFEQARTLNPRSPVFQAVSSTG